MIKIWYYLLLWKLKVIIDKFVTLYLIVYLNNVNALLFTLKKVA